MEMTHFSRARLLLNVLSVPEFVAGGFVEKQEHIYLSSICHPSVWDQGYGGAGARSCSDGPLGSSSEAV